jgi:hypothetical protein
MSFLEMNHVVFFSSGAASTVAAMRVAQKYGTKNLYLLFADTGIEDEDNYRFLEESANYIGGHLIRIKDGRTPWDVFNEGKWLSHRQGEKGCSYQLKILPCKQWIESNPEITPKNTVLYFGINFEEIHRIDAISANWSPYQVDTPLCWDEFGWADKAAVFAALKEANLAPPGSTKWVFLTQTVVDSALRQGWGIIATYLNTCLKDTHITNSKKNNC